jgi:hypothetical protein
LNTEPVSRGAAFAAALMMPFMLVLTSGLAGSAGNSVASGIAIVASIALLAAVTHRQPLTIDQVDIAFGAIVLAAVVSSVTAALPPSRNEAIALALTLAGYAAARRLTFEDMPFLRSAVMWAAAGITAIGTPLTAYALWDQWNEPHGRPIVLGLPSAASMLTIVLGFLVIAAATGRFTPWRAVGWCMVLALAVAIAAASMVRFPLVAVLGAVVIAAFLAGSRSERYGAIAIALTIVVAIGCGLAARQKFTALYMRQFAVVAERSAAQVRAEAKPSRMPAAPDLGSRDRVKCGVDLDNSLEIRKSLLAMALQMIPQAGPFGLGLDAFQQNTCLGMSPHNTILQTAIELGWVGGGMLVALVAAMMWRLLAMARTDRAVAFLLCSLAYVCVLSLAHGRLSRQGDLFLILGASAGVVTSLSSARRKSV